MSRFFALASLFVCIFSQNLFGQDDKKQILKLNSLPSWIWLTDENANNIAVRHEFELKGEVKQALLATTADNQCDVFINDKKAASSDDWAQLATADVSNRLKRGKNVISASAKNDGGLAGSDQKG